MADIPELFSINSKPGVKRDGTSFDSEYYEDAQWCRFQRGRPKKIGGYNQITNQVTGPVRNTYIDSRLGTNSVHTFSPWGVQRLNIDGTGVGGAITDRTPAGFVRNDNYTWQSSAMYSSTGGAYTALIAAVTPDLGDISNDAPGAIYAGDITGTAPLTAIAETISTVVTPIAVSGGAVVVGPFLFAYGSNGLIRNSNANDFSAATGWATGGSSLANSANIGGTKIVKGFAQRGGSGAPASLYWALDGIIRVTFVGGTSIWRYDPVTTSISVMSKAGIIEYDGLYFWAGIDRFFVYNGVVQELPNQMSANWFFDNLNYAQRQKVWAMKVPRYGEIWWFYPRGSATECTDVIIYNVREQTWYDSKFARSSGYESQVFHYPVMAGIEDAQTTTFFPYTGGTGVFRVGDQVTGGTSAAKGIVARSLVGSVNLTNLSGTFASGETITGLAGGTGILSNAGSVQLLDTVWQHEIGHDKVVGPNVTAIDSYFTLNNFSFKTGGPANDIGAVDVESYVLQVQPDFNQIGPMSLYVVGGSFANSANVFSAPYTFTNATEHIDMREQRGIANLKFESNVVGGDYEMGQCLVQVMPGDTRG